MGYIREEILRSSTEIGTNIIEIGPEEMSVIRDSIKYKYTNHAGSLYLWKDITGDVSLQDAEGWRIIAEFVKDEQPIMFFDEIEEHSAFIFQDGRRISDVLENTIGFEFYVTNKSTDFLICFNHHDYLITAGRAGSWLQEQIDSQN